MGMELVGPSKRTLAGIVCWFFETTGKPNQMKRLKQRSLCFIYNNTEHAGLCRYTGLQWHNRSEKFGSWCFYNFSDKLTIKHKISMSLNSYLQLQHNSYFQYAWYYLQYITVCTTASCKNPKLTHCLYNTLLYAQLHLVKIRSLHIASRRAYQLNMPLNVFWSDLFKNFEAS